MQFKPFGVTLTLALGITISRLLLNLREWPIFYFDFDSLFENDTFSLQIIFLIVLLICSLLSDRFALVSLSVLELVRECPDFFTEGLSAGTDVLFFLLSEFIILCYKFSCITTLFVI